LGVCLPETVSIPIRSANHVKEGSNIGGLKEYDRYDGLGLAEFIRSGGRAVFTERHACGICRISNDSGQPAMSVPLHWSDDGLPCGVQCIAPIGNETTLFQLAAQLEEERPWFDKRPPEPGVCQGEH